MNMNSSPSDFGSGFSNENLDSVTIGFKDENVCGEGATCHVYRMRINGLQVAVKRLKSDFLTNPTYLAAFRKEFHIGQRLKHDSLPIYREYREDSKEVYIVMDYVDGISLEDFIRTPEGQSYFRSTDNVRRFLSELIGVVSYLHRSGVIHCDLKPANIMLRHSDRGVMLIDLDKAYSDVLNLTHGGTVNVSAPLDNGQKPTVQKDFAAIGHIVEAISNRVPKFPTRKFRRFQKECFKEDVSISRLQSKLDNKPYVKILVVAGIVGVMAVVGSIIWSIIDFRKEPRPDSIVAVDTDDQIAEKYSATETQDSIALKFDSEVSEEGQSESSNASIGGTMTGMFPSVSGTTSKSVEIDVNYVDSSMAEFRDGVEDAYKALSTGLTRKDISGYVIKLGQSYTVFYQALVKSAKLRYPDVPSIDVELAVARAYERSRTGKLFIKFNEAVADSFKIWDSPVALDNNLQ